MAETDRVPFPKEAHDFISKKINVKSEHWSDLKHGEHSHSFTVAHSMQGAVSSKIHDIMNKSLAEGKSFNTFKKEMLEMMSKENWYGGAGHTKDDKKYIAWRLKVIYHTNMRTAYMAGRYRKMLAGARLRPIWEYVSKLVGNRREEHLALHGKAFRFDDPIWNEIYPPKGWGCDCDVVSLSESGAEHQGVEVLESDDDGNPPIITGKNGKAVDWNNFAPPEWKYNPGKEALAPNFENYGYLSNYPLKGGDTALDRVKENYRKDMEKTKLSAGEFDVLMKHFAKKDYQPTGTIYQVGNLDQPRFKAMATAGVADSKIMADDIDLQKNQKVPERLLPDLYRAFQEPGRIYEDTTVSKNKGRVFYFVKSTKDGRAIKITVSRRQAILALKFRFAEWVEDAFDGKFKEIYRCE